MKLIELCELCELCEKETKQVNYFGIILTVDANVNFLAADRNGFVYGYAIEPVILTTYPNWLSRSGLDNGYYYYPVAKVEIGEKNWKETLVEV